MQQTIIKPYEEHMQAILDKTERYGGMYYTSLHRFDCEACKDTGVATFLDDDTRWLLCSCDKGRNIGIEHGRIAMRKASLIGLEK